MDFKTELQNLVNKYPGMIKRVKVEFVKEIAVEPNGAPTIQYAPIPVPAPAVQARVAPKSDMFEIDNTPKPFPGQKVDGARPMPTITEKKSLSAAEQKALNATMVELMNPPQV